MNRISLIPIARAPRDVVEDLKELRKHVFDIEEEVGQPVFKERTAASSLGSLAWVIRIETEAGDTVGYLPIYSSFTP